MTFEGKNANLLMIPIVAGVATTDTNGYTRIGSFELEADALPDPSSELRLVLETSNVLNNADIRIFNVTTSLVLGADPLLTTVSLTPVFLTAALTPTAGSNLYELQMKMRIGTAPDQVTCSHAVVLYSWSDF